MKPVIGLTGEIGAGKSTVAGICRDLGLWIIDADQVGHEVLKQESIKKRLADAFGTHILDSDNDINRKVLGKQVFTSPQALRELEQIVHPAMEATFEHQIAQAQADPDVPATVLDAAILFERGWDRFCQRVMAVIATREIRLNRLQAARHWSEADLTRREKAQWPSEEKQQRADAIITNNTSPEDLTRQVNSLLRDWVDTDCPPKDKV